jgi:hypothetical protein
MKMLRYTKRVNVFHEQAMLQQQTMIILTHSSVPKEDDLT